MRPLNLTVSNSGPLCMPLNPKRVKIKASAMTNTEPLEIDPTPESTIETAHPESSLPTIPPAPEPITEIPALEAVPVAAEQIAITAPASISTPVAEIKAEPEAVPAKPEEPAEPEESFADLFSEFERTHKRARSEDGPRQLEGTVISIGVDAVYIDIGYKIEGAIPRSDFENNAEKISPGQKFPVSIKGRTEDGYYALTRFRVAQPTDWTALEAAFDQKLAIVGTVTALVKGGLTVDLGVRAFLPASRSGTRDAVELEKLVGTEITCRITKLDVADEDVVVDRRSVLEEQAKSRQQGLYADLKVGAVVKGTVRSLASYGAFVDLDGIDGLLHVSDISWARVNDPKDVLAVGQELEVKILKIDADSKRISLGLKQLQAEPWETVPARYLVGQRVNGTVTRLADFGAFIEIEPGVEGLIHVSELSWTKKVRTPADVLKAGDAVDAIILAIKPEERRLSLGLKQTLANPWSEISSRFPVGSQITGPVMRLTNFGAFIQIEEGVEGLVHVSEISEKRIHHPQDALRVGEVVKALVLVIDTEKRQVKLSIKQLVPTSIDEFLAEHKIGDLVSGRVVSENSAELGEGVFAQIRAKAPSAATSTTSEASTHKPDLSALTSKLQSRWKGQDKFAPKDDETLRPGQIRNFKITILDLATKKLEVEAV
jgi:small subunit ribosomal protein S1